MAASLLLSLTLIILEKLGFTDIKTAAQRIIADADFRHLLLNGMLSFLLFGGSLSLDEQSLRELRWPIATLATVSTIASFLLIGSLSYLITTSLHLNIPILYCYLFGALISPTDPIAVLAMLKKFNASRQIKAVLAGESLFNDGIGIVLFLSLLGMITHNTSFSIGHFIYLFIQESIGGLLYGYLLGRACVWMMQSVSNLKISILITLATVTGGYTFAQSIAISGPLAMVMAGIIVNNHITTTNHNTTKTTNTEYYANIHVFWEIIDDILNAILFMLIGFEILIIPISHNEMIATLSLIPIVLLARLITAALPAKILGKSLGHQPNTIAIITWGGLRGGLAVALALSIPHPELRNSIVAFTYGIVAFSILIQGSTIPLLLRSKKKQ